MLLSLSLLGCIDEGDGPDTPTWEEFKASSTRRLDGKQIYAIQWDLAVSVEDLRAYYLEHVALEPDDGSGSALGTSEPRSFRPCDCDLKECRPMCALPGTPAPDETLATPPSSTPAGH